MKEKPRQPDMFPEVEKKPGLADFKKLRLELEERDKIKKAKERKEKIDKILNKNKNA